MVGLAIGLVLVAGLALMFAKTSQSGNELEKSIRQIENGRHAVEILREDISHAGYYGEIPADALGYTTPDVCATTLANLGWDKTTPSAPKAPMPIMGLLPSVATATACLSNYKAGTAAFAIHRLGTEPLAPASAAANTVYMQTSRCSTDPAVDPFVVSATATDFTLQNRQCNAVNQVRPYVSRIYYIATCNECGSDTTPTLKMAELRGNQMVTVPVAEGIENMVLEYGFDTNDDGNPEVFITGLSGVAGAAHNDWAKVVAVRLQLISRTIEPSSDYFDEKTYVLTPASTASGDGSAYVFTPASRTTEDRQFKRRVYSATARLNNVAGLREAPPAPAASAASAP